MKIIICGGRDMNYADAFNWFERDMAVELAHASGCHGEMKIDRIIHGGCKGADSAADAWAKSEGIPVIACPADWKKHGKAAGPIRNRQMIEIHNPDYVVALPGGKGTADMISQAESHGIPVIRIGDW